MPCFKRITVKIGSNVLTHADGTLDTQRMQSLVHQIAQLHRAGVEIVLVSSGAVASGRGELKVHTSLDVVSARQVFSAIGQAKLIGLYYEMFRNEGLLCGQVLSTKESLGTRRHYLNQRNCILELLAHGIIPIVNENDTISLTELMFTDNDELSGVMATMVDAEALIILSNIDGIYNGVPSDPTSQVIRTVEPGKNLSQYIHTGKSSFGRGGMLTKTSIARKVAEEGICVIIANGKRDHILPDLLDENNDMVCTRFTPNTKATSGIKKWIAHSESFAKGEVQISVLAEQALLSSDQATSLLLVGVTDVRGEFEKNDIVRIVSPNGRVIGVGKTQYDSQKARQNMGRKGLRPLIHYDYLFLE